jgi:hypothetical protein
MGLLARSWAVRVVAWLTVLASTPSRTAMAYGQVEVLAEAEGDQVVGEVGPAVAVVAAAVADGVEAPWTGLAAGYQPALAAGGLLSWNESLLPRSLSVITPNYKI